ncbi:MULTISPECIES: hypothetical protein [Priestia]|nr:MULTISPECIES: hypothetical protein [Priestia]MDC0701111.1 hypothetical protein [Priestia sp. AB]MED4211578.1 hypothetical protein [Priestia megaterium]
MYGYGGCCYPNYPAYLCGGGFGWGLGLLIVLFVLLLIFGSFYWFFSCWY